jgi:Mor family transcriptional regulator
MTMTDTPQPDARNNRLLRNADIISRRAAGETYAAIAASYAITEQRAWQICREHESRQQLEKLREALHDPA